MSRRADVSGEGKFADDANLTTAEGSAAGLRAGPSDTSSRAKVFVSYSRSDLEFAQTLVNVLHRYGFEAFLDKTDIAPGEPWKERLAALIAGADTIAFVVSPDAVASPVCAWELGESTRLGKRVIPLVARRIANIDAPPALSRLNWIFCSDGDDKDAAFTALDRALRIDLPWVREHTRLGDLAQRWKDGGRTKTATLRGAELEAAERWLDSRPEDGIAPTTLQREYIRVSRRAATIRQRNWIGGSLMTTFVALALAGWAEFNRREAQAQRDVAEIARNEARVQRDAAEVAKQEAQSQRDAAESAKKEAENQRDDADMMRDVAAKDRDRMSQALDAAAMGSSEVVAHLATEFGAMNGLPKDRIRDILKKAIDIQDDLHSSNEITNIGVRLLRAYALVASGKTFITVDDPIDAINVLKKAENIWLDLTSRSPENVEWQSELAGVFDLSGDILAKSGDFKQALSYYTKSLAVIRILPTSSDLRQRHLAYTLARIGGLQLQLGIGNRSDAQTALKESMRIFCERANQINSDEARTDLSTMSNAISRLLEQAVKCP